MVRCPRCGATVQAGRKFCTVCGAELTAPVSTLSATPMPSPETKRKRGSLKLILILMLLILCACIAVIVLAVGSIDKEDLATQVAINRMTQTVKAPLTTTAKAANTDTQVARNVRTATARAAKTTTREAKQASEPGPTGTPRPTMTPTPVTVLEWEGVYIGMPADDVLKIHPKSETIEDPVILGEDSEGLIVRWSYPSAYLIFAVREGEGTDSLGMSKCYRVIEIQLPNTLTPETSTAETIIHIVQSGETLSIIAKKYSTTAETLAALNNIEDPDKIEVGQELVISVPPGWTPPPTSTPLPAPPTATPTPESSFDKWFYSGKAVVAVSDINRHGELGIWKPSSGYVFVSVGIHYGNRGDSGTVHCNPFNFKIKTSEGVIYYPSIATLEPDLKAVELAPGGQTKGWVTFEVPADVKDLTLLWEPSLFSETVEIPLR